MKQMLLFLGCLLCFGASAQLTLTSANYPGPYEPSTDSFFRSGTTTTLVAVPAAANAMWNLAGDVSMTPVWYQQRVAPASGTTFASAQWGNPETAMFSTFPINETFEQAITSTSFNEYGISVPGTQGYSIASVTGGATDSIIFDAQNDVYSTPRILIKFPATYMSNWSSSKYDHFNVHLSIAAAAYSDAPGYKSESILYLDTVVGWGEMKVRQTNGDTSGYMNVLQIKEIVTSEDSFYVNGTPAPAVLLAGFGVTQGEVSKGYRQYYYRVGEVSPLAEIDYSDSSFQTPTTVQTHNQRLAFPAGVVTVEGNIGINVYPNPVANHIINVDITGAQEGSWNYELINMLGARVAASALTVASQSAHSVIDLPANVASGIYFLRLINNGKEITVRPLDIR